MKKGFANRVSRKEMDNFKPKLLYYLLQGAQVACTEGAIRAVRGSH